MPPHLTASPISDPELAETAPWVGYEIVRSFPHDRTAFTQGLVYHDGYLYESTGLTGQSRLRQVEIETGRVVREIQVPPPHFAEGLAELGGRLFQLTWHSQIGFIYDLATFRQVGTFGYPGEGWGLTHDGSQLVMSDGSATLRFIDPASLAETRRIRVRDGALPQDKLNELEFIRGEIFANVWMTDTLVAIDPWSGRITGRLNLQGLLGAEDRRQKVDVLNGIAYDEAQDRLFVTGKLWPKLFELRLRRP